MARIPFSQVLKNVSINIRKEYDRLYKLFCVDKYKDSPGNSVTLRRICAKNFTELPFRGTCISLDDFDISFGYNFVKEPFDFSLDYLVSFCEYSYNLSFYNQYFTYGAYLVNGRTLMHFYLQQVLKVIENLGYMPLVDNGITDFVPKDQVAISVAEIIDTSLSYKVIEYNHHSMKGDLNRKKEILLALADRLEPQRDKLKHNNSQVQDDLFFLFNNLNLRHNNIDPEGKDYKPFVASMEKEELEKWYDDIYQMCLLAFLELDHIDRKDRIKELKDGINSK